jgi:hypothetical protein
MNEGATFALALHRIPNTKNDQNTADINATNGRLHPAFSDKYSPQL